MNLSAQKYKIWINTSWIIFLTKKAFTKLKWEQEEMVMVMHDPSKSKVLESMNGMLSNNWSCPIFVLSDSPKKFWDALLLKCSLIQAAGGLVSYADRSLFIYRRGYWDLPKGKLDKGENNKTAALREVWEEVGLRCTIVGKLPYTYHAYVDKGRLVIKQTAWFLMQATSDKVILQSSEDIERKKWVPNTKIHSMIQKVYPNLSIVLNQLKS